MTENIKLVVVGDGGVGKTCMLISYTNNTFPDEGDYVPTIFDNFPGMMERIGNKVYSMGLWDTAGQQDYDRLRPLSYPQTNVFLIVFSITDRKSLENVSTKWYPEIQHHSKGIPIVLVGSKIDLREDADLMRDLQERNESMVTRQEGEKVARELRLKGYYECSAKTQKGLKDVFRAAVNCVVGSGGLSGLCESGKCGVCPKCRSKKCLIL